MTEHEALRALNLEPGCSAEQVRQSYRELVKVWHPDRFPGDPELRAKADRTLQRLNEAYAVLKDGSSQAPAPPASPPSSESSSTQPAASTGRTRPTRALVTAVVLGGFVGVGYVLFTEQPWQPISRVSTSPPAAVDETPPSLPERLREPERAPDLGRPESGTDVRQPAATGRGRAVIQNGLPDDAVVVFSTGGRTQRVVFVRGGEKLTLLDLAPATVEVRVMAGREWTGRRFLRRASHFAREEPMRIVATGDTPVMLMIAPGSGFRPIQPFPLD